MKGWQSMKRIIMVLALAAGMLGLVAVPASATPPTDCAFSHYHSALTYYNGLTWSAPQRAHHTPFYRAGACGKVYVEFLGVYNAPACAYFRLVTYNEDHSQNYVGAWYQFTYVGQLRNIRGSGYINNGRKYRIYTYGCGSYRHRNFPPGMMIYTHAA